MTKKFQFLYEQILVILTEFDDEVFQTNRDSKTKTADEDNIFFVWRQVMDIEYKVESTS